MGITIVQKSDLAKRKHGARIALVLAGGAVSGGAYKLGGLKALNDYFINRKITDFDLYIGLSAGALLAAPLANGISPEEVLKSLSGKSDSFDPLRPWDFYWPNFREFLRKPARFALEMVTFSPVVTLVLAAAAPQIRKQFRELAENFVRHPSYRSLERLGSTIIHEISQHLEIPDPVQGLLPSGIFENSRIESYLRRNIEKNNAFNRFDLLKRETGKSLYIVATNLDTAERAVFGWDEISDISISRAVQASTAIPGFYAPVRIDGQDYIDGGVRKTANIDLAVEKGAELIVVYNPFRPLVTQPQDKKGRKAVRRLADEGMLSILNQVFRTLLHTRLHIGMERYLKDPDFRGDIILIEPTETEATFFDTNPVAFWQRARSAQIGFQSVTESIEANFDRIRPILRSYGIEISRHFVNADLQRMERAHGDMDEILDILEEPAPLRSIELTRGGAA